MKKFVFLYFCLISTTYGQNFNKLLDNVQELILGPRGVELFLSNLGSLYGLDSQGNWRIREERIIKMSQGAAIDKEGVLYKVTEEASLYQTYQQVKLASVGKDGIELKVKKNGLLFFGDQQYDNNFIQLIAHHKNLAAGLSISGHYYLKKENSFEKVGEQRFKQIALGEDGIMAALGLDNFVYVKIGGAYKNGQWQKTPHKAKKIYIKDLKNFYKLTINDELFVSHDFMLIDHNFTEFQIKNLQTTLCLENIDGREVQVQNCSLEHPQFWQRVDHNNGYVIKSAKTKNCLFPFGNNEGSPIGLWQCNENAVVNNGPGMGIIQFQRGCLDVNKMKEKGDGLMLWKDCPEGDFQRWAFTNFRYKTP
ncbi:MAG: RICIN domain-containing protein [Bdellovibrionales bacterium]|jgi:hypothetical protein|nr:RICIN domain-containing protein [Bdellovibrionales bacterium]